MKTKRPWQYHRLGPDFKTFYVTGAYSAVTDSSAVVAETIHNELDAALIAAAPEMLDTLRHLLSNMVDQGDPEICALRVLIAKAEGWKNG